MSNTYKTIFSYLEVSFWKLLLLLNSFLIFFFVLPPKAIVFILSPGVWLLWFDFCVSSTDSCTECMVPIWWLYLRTSGNFRGREHLPVGSKSLGIAFLGLLSITPCCSSLGFLSTMGSEIYRHMFPLPWHSAQVQGVKKLRTEPSKSESWMASFLP